MSAFTRMAMVLLTATAMTTAKHTTLVPGSVWADTEGVAIDAHGAGLLQDGSATYWYGTKRHGHPNVAPRGKYPPYAAYCYPPRAPGPSRGSRTGSDSGSGLGDGFTEGVNLYVADGDLYNWRHAGLVFPANATGAHCLERPKVIKCPATGQYVLWAKGFTPDRDVQAVVATSLSPLGPFTLQDPSQPFYAPDNTSMADATVWVDTDTAHGNDVWLYWRSRNRGFLVGKLNKDCTRLDSSVPVKVIANKQHEAPAVFRHGGRVYVWTSSTTGFNANPARLLVSPTGAAQGPFVEAGNPTHNLTSFASQSTFILPNPAFNSTPAAKRLAEFIYLADRWQTKTADFGRYLWLPLVITAGQGVNHTVRVTNPSSWQYDAPVPSTSHA